MRVVIFSWVPLCTCVAYSQYYHDDTIIANKGFKRCIITGTEYEQGGISNIKRCIETYNDKGQVTTRVVLDKKNRITDSLVFFYSNRDTVSSFGYDGKRKLQSVSVSARKGRNFINYVLSARDDTMSIHRMEGNTYNIYWKDHNERQIIVEDDEGNMLLRRTEDAKGRLLSELHFLNKRVGNCWVTYPATDTGFVLMRTCSEGNKTKIDYHFPLGIPKTTYRISQLTIAKDPSAVVIERSDDEINSLITYYNSSDEVIATITFEYMK